MDHLYSRLKPLPMSGAFPTAESAITRPPRAKESRQRLLFCKNSLGTMPASIVPPRWTRMQAAGDSIAGGHFAGGGGLERQDNRGEKPALTRLSAPATVPPATAARTAASSRVLRQSAISDSGVPVGQNTSVPQSSTRGFGMESRWFQLIGPLCPRQNFRRPSACRSPTSDGVSA
jgi:hypothetical protein